MTTATDIAKPAKKSTKAKRAAKTEKSAEPREGSKTAQVVAMLQWLPQIPSGAGGGRRITLQMMFRHTLLREQS